MRLSELDKFIVITSRIQRDGESEYEYVSDIYGHFILECHNPLGPRAEIEK